MEGTLFILRGGFHVEDADTMDGGQNGACEGAKEGEMDLGRGTLDAKAAIFYRVGG